MNRLLTLARGTADPDGHLLGRFLADRDEAAFAELVRRYAPVVWGTCRRLLPHQPDAEDAFQATFLVLIRRAGRLTDHPALGPWLYRVAVLTARNLARANRRQHLAGPLDHDIPAPAAEAADARLDLDAALSSLSARQRSAVVLCHLQGLTRAEAAGRLGCAEGTLSATLAAALKKLRRRLAGRDPLVLLVATTIPVGLSAATARTAAIYTTSAVRAAGVSPAVAGLTEGVLRMYWMKKVSVAAGLLVAAAGLAVGVGAGSGVARQDAAKAPPAKAAARESDDDVIRKLTADLRLLELDEITIQKKLEEVRQARVKAEVRRAEAQRAQLRQALVGKFPYWEIVLPGDSWSAPPVTGHAVRIEEYDAAGKGVGGFTVSPSPRLLKRVLAGGLADPDGPRKAVLKPEVPQVTADQINVVLQALKEAGLTEVVYVPLGTAYPTAFDEPKLLAGLYDPPPAAHAPPDGSRPVVLNLAKFNDKTKAVATREKK